MLFIQTDRQEDTGGGPQAGHASGLQAELPNHSWSLLGSYRVSDGVNLSGEGCPE